MFLVIHRLHVRAAGRGRRVAIGALQFHRAVWSAQIIFQVYLMIKLDGPRVRVARPKHREFRMAAIEPADVRRELGWPMRGG